MPPTATALISWLWLQEEGTDVPGDRDSARSKCTADEAEDKHYRSFPDILHWNPCDSLCMPGTICLHAWVVYIGHVGHEMMACQSL
jgi:hypothetical protein